MNLNIHRLLVAVGLLVFWAPAHAYIDPGTGSALIAALVAAFAAVYTTIKLYWHRFVGFFSSKSDEEEERNSGDEAKER